jgi:hypothetical protein
MSTPALLIILRDFSNYFQRVQSLLGRRLDILEYGRQDLDDEGR